MAIKETHKLLLELRKQLDELNFTNLEAKEKAVKLTELIDKTVDFGEAESAAHRELKYQLKDSVLYFEVSHPTLTAAINNLINTLNNIGI
jgi:hypothetical protein